MLIKTKIHNRTIGGKCWSFVNLFEERVDVNPDIVQFITADDDKAISLGMLDMEANQIAHWGKGIGLKQKNTVCLMMLNRPDFVAFWIGMGKIGVSTALLNTNITGKGFIHSVDVSLKHSEVKVLVVDNDIVGSLTDEIRDLKDKGYQIFLWNELSKKLNALPISRPPKSYRDSVLESDPLVMIFTSGTTGLPKAAKITSTKFFIGGLPLSVMGYLKPGVRSYGCLPLYHSAGGMLGVSACLQTGATMVIR